MDNEKIDWETKYKRALKICELHLEQGAITFLVASDIFREMWENKLDPPYYKYYRKEINNNKGESK